MTVPTVIAALLTTLKAPTEVPVVPVAPVARVLRVLALLLKVLAPAPTITSPLPLAPTAPESVVLPLPPTAVADPSVTAPLAAAALAQRAAQDFAARTGTPVWLCLTGGGAEAVAERLPLKAPWPAGIAGIELQPDLVLQGLAVMAAASRDGLRHY